MFRSEIEPEVRSGRRRRPPLVTRDQALRVAYQLIREEGPDGLSMRKLATGLSVSLPTVYTSIQSKEALVRDVQRQIVDEIEVAALTALQRASAAPAALLGVLLASLAEWTIDNPTLADFLLTTDLAEEARQRVAVPSRTRLGLTIDDLCRSGHIPRGNAAAHATFAAAELRTLMALCRDGSSALEVGIWTDAVEASLTCGLRRLSERLNG